MSDLIDAIVALGYSVTEQDGVLAIRGFGIAVMARADDNDALASIADRAAHTERAFQAIDTDAAAARAKLEAAGYTVTRSDPTVDVFTIAPALQVAAPLVKAATTLDVSAAAATPADLVKIAQQLVDGGGAGGLV